VIKVGEFDKTILPLPVDVVTPVPPEVTANGANRVRVLLLVLFKEAPPVTAKSLTVQIEPLVRKQRSEKKSEKRKNRRIVLYE
jgi:hypothetical protein